MLMTKVGRKHGRHILMMKPMRPRRDSVMMMFSSENVRLAKRRSSCKKRWASQINWREREGVD